MRVSDTSIISLATLRRDDIESFTEPFNFFVGRRPLEAHESSKARGNADDRYVYEKQRYDGWFNNMAHPEWGSVGTLASHLVLYDKL